MNTTIIFLLSAAIVLLVLLIAVLVWRNIRQQDKRGQACHVWQSQLKLAQAETDSGTITFQLN